MKSSLPIILAATGASGAPYFMNLLRFLVNNNFKIHLVLSTNAISVIEYETGLKLSTDEQIITESLLKYLSYPDNDNLIVNNINDLSAPIASGSYKTQGMIILPCSVNTLSAIKNGIAGNLITRAASVCIKEGRKLILSPREMPFSCIDLENMYYLAIRGVKIIPPCPAFYNKPNSIDDMVDFVVGKILDSFEVGNDLYKRWQ